jgi:hypothetical protein
MMYIIITSRFSCRMKRKKVSGLGIGYNFNLTIGCRVWLLRLIFEGPLNKRVFVGIRYDLIHLVKSYYINGKHFYQICHIRSVGANAQYVNLLRNYQLDAFVIYRELHAISALPINYRELEKAKSHEKYIYFNK